MSSTIKILFMPSYNIISLLLLIVVFQFGCDKEVTVSVSDDQIPNAFLYVSSYPQGSEIYLNGKNSGKITPDFIPYLDNGEYSVTLKKKYFRDTTFKVILKQPDTSKVHIDYFNNPLMLGRIYFNSTPAGCDIFIDDSATGLKTPSSLNNIKPGLYTIKYQKNNYRDVVFPLAVESNKLSTAYNVLRDTSIWVDYQTTNSNIQSNNLTCIAVDNQNNKWIGTAEQGLLKYDENQFINFTTFNSGLPSSHINCINVSNDNQIWIGTPNGIAVINQSSWTVYNTSNSGLNNNNVNKIIFDNSNKVWIGTNNGFCSFDGTNWKNYNYSSEKFTYLWVTSLAFDSQENLWIGSSEFGILKFKNNQFIEFTDSVYNFPTNKITTIDVENNNNVWFGHNLQNLKRSGISVFNNSVFINFYLGTNANKINSIYVNGNKKWISTSEGLVYLSESNNSTTFRTLNSLISSDYVTGAVMDKNSIIWVITNGGGLNKFKSNY